MKRIIIATSLVAAALSVVAFRAGSAMDDHVATLQSAKSLNVEYTLTELGKAGMKVNVSLTKPNLARIETARDLIIADGSKITRYDKPGNSYTVAPQTDASLNELFKSTDLAVWGAFFNKDSMATIKNLKNGSPLKRGSVTYDTVEGMADNAGRVTARFYLSQDDGVTRQAEIVDKTMSTTVNTLMNTTKVEMNGNIASDLFAFAPPAGATEVKASDVLGNWIHDFEKGLGAAKSSKAMMIVDFYATWCGPCKRLDAECFGSQTFRNATKDCVLVKVDAEIRTDLAQKYGVTAYPTVIFFNENGEVIHKAIGYGGVDSWMDNVTTARGKM